MSACERHGKTKGDDSWEEVVAPFDCSYYSITPFVGQTFDKCCDPSNANTHAFGISGHAVLAPPINSPGQRWVVGDVITYVRSSSPLNLYFLR